LQTAAERGQTKLAEELADLEDMVIRREEWMAAQQMINGYVDVKGTGVDYRIDLGMDASHKITVSTSWSDATNSTPLSDVSDGVRLIAKDAGIGADAIIGNSAAIELFLNSTEVMAKLNTRRIDLGLLKPSEMGDGVSYYGDVFAGGKTVGVYSYDEWYVDDNDIEQPMIPDNKVIVTSSKADARRHYGAIKDKKAGFAAVPRFPKIWDEEDPAAEFLMVQSAPLPAFHQIDAVVVLTV